MVSCEHCRNEFRLKNFVFQHDTPRAYIQFQFGYVKLYLIWRIIWALYHTAMIIYTGIRVDVWAGEDTSQHIKWFIFLTDWAYLILTVSTIFDAAMVIYVLARRPDIRNGITDSLPWYMKATWCVFNMGNVISVTTSVAYWALVYDGTQAMSANNIITHIVNSLYVILNICVTGMPMRLLHFWMSSIVGVIYSLFTYIYYVSGGTNHNENPYVYPAIDWRDPGTAILYCVIISFVAVPVVHLGLFGLHCVKMLIYRKCDCCIASAETDNSTTVEMKSQYPY
ncbi:hypothetical protein ACF0H5_014243 [Mactra antiquata]